MWETTSKHSILLLATTDRPPSRVSIKANFDQPFQLCSLSRKGAALINAEQGLSLIHYGDPRPLPRRRAPCVVLLVAPLIAGPIAVSVQGTRSASLRVAGNDVHSSKAITMSDRGRFGSPSISGRKKWVEPSKKM